MYLYLIIWRVRVTTVAMETQRCFLCVWLNCVTVNNIQILSVAQQYLYGKLNVADNSRP